MAAIVVFCVLAIISLTFGNPVSSTEAAITLTKAGKEVVALEVQDRKAKESSQTTSPHPSANPQNSTLTVRVTSLTFMIQEIGTTVNFTCQAQSSYTSEKVPVDWSKVDGDLPPGRTYINPYAGLLSITNLQVSDSSQYICQTGDGFSTGRALVTLKVSANDMTLPSVIIKSPVNDYYEGNRIQLECVATGNPTPTISWQRASGRPLPMSVEHFDKLFIIESASVEDSGEYRCIASNTAGSSESTAVISVRIKPSKPPRDRLKVTPAEPSVNEGQSTNKVICTGSTNVPAGTVYWISQDGARFQQNVRSNDGVLYIDNATLENQCVYICQTHAADVAPVPIVLNIVPQGTPPPGEQPEIDVPIKSLKVPSGESESVDCVPRGYPLPEVKWTKYQSEFGRGTSQRGNTLIINNAEETDQGFYVCEGIIDNQVINKIYVLVEIDIDYSTSPRPSPNPQNPPYTVRITSPTIMIQEIGTSVNFTCQAQRLPVDWSKVDGDLPQGRAYIDPYAGLLTITNLQISDSGQYICQTYDGLSTGQALVTLKVPANDMTLPSVIINPPVIDSYEGDRIQLECVATGNPSPTISWQRASGRPLPMSVELFDKLFIIESGRVEDSGEYKCIASNTAGSSGSTAVISVRTKPSRPPRDRLMVTPTEPNVNEGQSTRVVCTGSTNVPAGTIDWIRQDGARFQQNVRSDNGVLYIDNAILENQGIYICQTHAADVAPVPIVLNIVPQGTPPPGEQPEIDVPIKSLKVPSGESGTVDCVPRGYPLPEVKWTKYQGEFGRGTSQRGNTLIINNAEETDQGYYVCEGIVDKQVINNIYVLVEIERREAPRVQIWPEGEQPVALGSRFEFHCRVVAGYPEPPVTWSRGYSRTLSPTTHIRDNNYYVLSFDSVDVNDEGEYICTANNIVGIHSASAVLRVRSPPVINITPRYYVVIKNGESNTIECRANGYPEPMLSIRGPDGETISEPTPGISVLRIASASERDQGDYTCTATSAAGTATDTFIVRVDKGGSDNPYEKPSDLIAAEGQKETTMNCNVASGFTPQWSRADQKPLQYNARQDGIRLIIYNVSKSDSGDYVCSIFNSETGEPQNAAYTTLRVVGAPRITLRPPTQTVSPGQSPIVECVVEGENIIEVNWKPYNRNLSGRVRIRNSTLIFQQIEVGDAGKYECVARNPYANASAIAEVIVAGLQEEVPTLMKIEQPTRRFRVGEKVEVLCKTVSRSTNVRWDRWDAQGTRQYVDTRTYGDGVILIIRGVTEGDAGVYRCTGYDPSGRSSFEDFNLEIEPGSGSPYPNEHDVEVAKYEARLGQTKDIPCNHDLEEPVSIRWRREYATLSSDIRSDRPILHLPYIIEGDAGTYVCRVSNMHSTVETKSVLRVIGIVPLLKGSGWIALPTLKDAYRQFDIEISFKPQDPKGIILYNSQFPRHETDYLALQTIEGVPEFTLDTGNGPVIVKGDRPLQLNEWHTIRLSKFGARVTMNVDNTGPFMNDTTENWVLELQEPLYIGGVPNYDDLPDQLAGTAGFAGCISMLVLGSEEKNIMIDAINKHEVYECDTCAPNQCVNDALCQEARNERGYVCLCGNGFAGRNCERHGEAYRHQ